MFIMTCGNNKQGEGTYFGLDWTANVWGPNWLSLSFATSKSFSCSMVMGNVEEEGLGKLGTLYRAPVSKKLTELTAHSITSPLILSEYTGV